jgi:acetoacetyl-CoA synthetase
MGAADREGVRVGADEIYRAAAAVPELFDALVVDVPRPGADCEPWMILFVVLCEGLTLDYELTARIKQCILEGCSAGHVPDEIYQIDDVPRTPSGKAGELLVELAATPRAHGWGSEGHHASSSPRPPEHA